MPETMTCGCGFVDGVRVEACPVHADPAPVTDVPASVVRADAAEVVEEREKITDEFQVYCNELTDERDAALVEVEDLRVALSYMARHAEWCGSSMYERTDLRPPAQRHRQPGPCDCGQASASALLSRPPSVAALRAREALAALAYMGEVEARHAEAARLGFHPEHGATRQLHGAYLAAREAREKAEREEPKP